MVNDIISRAMGWTERKSPEKKQGKGRIAGLDLWLPSSL